MKRGQLSRLTQPGRHVPSDLGMLCDRLEMAFGMASSLGMETWSGEQHHRWDHNAIHTHFEWCCSLVFHGSWRGRTGPLLDTVSKKVTHRELLGNNNQPTWTRPGLQYEAAVPSANTGSGLGFCILNSRFRKPHHDRPRRSNLSLGPLSGDTPRLFLHPLLVFKKVHCLPHTCCLVIYKDSKVKANWPLWQIYSVPECVQTGCKAERTRPPGEVLQVYMYPGLICCMKKKHI